jgi:hypothetical protein
MAGDKADGSGGTPVSFAIPALVLKADAADGKLKLDEGQEYQLLALSARVAAGGLGATKDDDFEYKLKVETHADNFFEIKHKITFFLITAAVGSLGYTLNFAVGRLAEVTASAERIVSLTVGAACGILTVGAALLSMYYDMQAYRRNLRAYFEKKTDDDDEWSTFRRRSTYGQRSAFALLFLSVLYQAALFLLFLI